MTPVYIDCERVGSNGTVRLSAKRGDELLAVEKLDLARSKQRDAFAARICEHRPDIDRAQLDAELLRLADETNRPAPAEVVECGALRIIRPELFYTPEVSGIAAAVPARAGGKITASWRHYLRWRGGRRQQREVGDSIDLAAGARLFVHPAPSAPSPTMAAPWSDAARRDWLEGAPAPNAAEVFKRTCESIARYVDLPVETAKGAIATLSLWVLLTYVYSAWAAVPYLSIGGPLGSGKSTLFRLLAQLVFRPVQSSNLTAACLFRTMHEQGGTLLLDEAERLRDSSPDASDMRSILLSGYKRGSPAMRLERAGDSFKRVTFDVYSPKAVASIANPPEALASRCIRLMMFRAAPDSPKPRRRIDADAAAFQAVRDDLHALALEHGPTWLQLAERSDVVPADLAGREYELWQPLLGLAAFIEDAGARGLLGLMQQHALAAASDARDDATPEAHELLLRIVATAVAEGRQANLKAGDVLRAARQEDPATFDRWSPRGVTESLKTYGLRTNKTRGMRVFARATLADIERIEHSYGIDILPRRDVPHVPYVPQSGGSGSC